MSTDPIVDTSMTRLAGCLVVHLEGEVDLSNTAFVQERITAEAHSGEPIVIDLTDLTYVDSAGLHLLYDLVNGTVLAHDVVLVAPPGSRARTVIDLAGVADALAVHDSFEASQGTRSRAGSDVPPAVGS